MSFCSPAWSGKPTQMVAVIINNDLGKYVEVDVYGRIPGYVGEFFQGRMSPGQHSITNEVYPGSVIDIHLYPEGYNAGRRMCVKKDILVGSTVNLSSLLQDCSTITCI